MKVGYIGIIGKPNAGKSTLLNTIIGEKLSIVTPKAQTTRKRIIGIYSTSEAQIIFIDTPGFTLKTDKLNQKLVEQAKGTMQEVDINLLLIDASKYMASLEADILYQLNTYKKPTFLILNKIDKIKKNYLLPTIDFYRNQFDFEEIFPISAKTNDGISHLIEQIISYLPEGDAIYSEDLLSNQPQRIFTEEFVREAIFQLLKEEIPYSTYVEITQFSESDSDTKKVEIKADIFVEKDSQKKIVIGKSGNMIRQIREYALKEIQNFLQQPVQLSLWVKVDKNWRNDAPEDKI